MLFFFNQKTAYEMRISDWSSDVCSSDLRGNLRGGMAGRGESCAADRSQNLERGGAPALRGKPPDRGPCRTRDGRAPIDRKSEGEGKRVPGGVEFGGGRLIKQKIHITLIVIRTPHKSVHK